MVQKWVRPKKRRQCFVNKIITSQNFRKEHWGLVGGKNNSTILSANGFIANSGIAIKSSRDKWPFSSLSSCVNLNKKNKCYKNKDGKLEKHMYYKNLEKSNKKVEN